MKKPYIILSGHSSGSLEQQVAAKMRDGYELAGGVCYDPANSVENSSLLQAMVLSKESRQSEPITEFNGTKYVPVGEGKE